MNLLLLHLIPSILLASDPAKPSIISNRATNFALNLPNLSPNTRRIYLLRHGMTHWNKAGKVQGSSYDIPLNDEGKSQASYAAEELSALPMNCIASSHLSRAVQTAEEVYAHHPSAARIISQDFVEMNYGELEGKAIHDDNEESRRFKARFDQVSTRMEGDVTVRYPGGENVYEVEQRTRKALYQLMRERSNDNHIAIVGHGRSNRILLASLLYNDATKFACIEQGNTAISIVDYDMEKDQWNEVLLNYVKHTLDRGMASGGRY